MAPCELIPDPDGRVLRAADGNVTQLSGRALTGTPRGDGAMTFVTRGRVLFTSTRGQGEVILADTRYEHCFPVSEL